MSGATPGEAGPVPERRHVPIAALGSELRLQLEAATIWQLRDHPDSRPRYPFGILIPLGAALLSCALLGLAFVVVSPFGFAGRWMPLLLGGALIGVWVAWRRRPEYRPAQGQALLPAQTCLVVVDEASVEVLPAEALTISDDGVRRGEALVHRGRLEPEVAAAVQEAIGRAHDPEARAADRWRAIAAEAAEPAPRQVPRKPLIAGGAIGVGLAIALELAVGLVRSHPAHDQWDLLARHLDKVMDVVSEREAEEHAQDLADLRAQAEAATSSFELLPLIDRGRLYAVERPLEEGLLRRYAELAVREVEATSDVRYIAHVLRTAVERKLDGGLLQAARLRISELALADARAATQVADFDAYALDEADRLGLDDGFRVAMRARLAEIVRVELALARTVTDVDRRTFELLDRHRLDDDTMALVRGRHAELARDGLARARSADDVVPVLEVLRTNHVEHAEELRRAAGERFVELARAALRGARSRYDVRPFVEIARRYDLGGEFIDELYERWKDIASSDLGGVRSGVDLVSAVRYWYEPAEAPLQAKLRPVIAARALALGEAARTATDLEPLLLLGEALPAEAAAALRARRERLAFAEAKAEAGPAGMIAARRYLGLPEGEPARVAEIRARLGELCAAQLGPAAEAGAGAAAEARFLATLARELCVELEPVLRWATAGDLETARRGARLLVARVGNFAEEAGSSFGLRELNVAAGRGHVTVEVEERGEWRGSANMPGFQERPCTYRFALADGSRFAIDEVCARRFAPKP